MNALPPFWQHATQAERDAAYNNTTAVTDSAALMAARNEASATFRATRSARLDARYGATEREAWDIFPGADPAAPCLAFIHGGYWQRNRREDFCCFAEAVMGMGWSAAFVGYSLAPEASLAEIVRQIRAALDWLAQHGPALGVAGPILLSGWSAGGHLTAMALDHPAIAAGLAISGVFELAPIRDTYLNEALKLTEQEIATLSPMRLPVVQKPLAIAYGTAELPELVRHSRDFHALRAAAHAPGPLLPVPHADHFRIMEELRRHDGTLVRAAAELMR
jgi:acetyl esterase/lipase